MDQSKSVAKKIVASTRHRDDCLRFQDFARSLTCITSMPGNGERNAHTIPSCAAESIYEATTTSLVIVDATIYN